MRHAFASAMLLLVGALATDALAQRTAPPVRAEPMVPRTMPMERVQPLPDFRNDTQSPTIPLPPPEPQSSLRDGGGEGDQDRDGWPDKLDCSDFNSAIHPSAVELPNGLDDNCNGVVDRI